MTTHLYTDQLGRQIEISEKPQRIISLVPSQTELLAGLGLENELVGITKFCIHPKAVYESKTKIGGTKNFNFERIDVLQPDLIIANKEENYQEGITQLAQKYPVWISDINNLDNALQMIQLLGQVNQCQEKANRMAQEIATRFEDFTAWKQYFLPKPIRVAYFIWRKPYMVASNGTFIDEMLKIAGYENVFGHLSRYPEISPEMLQEANPDWIFLSSEPYPFKADKHFKEFASICPQAGTKIIDGELFSWYGSRLLYSPTYFQQLLRSIWGDERMA